MWGSDSGFGKLPMGRCLKPVTVSWATLPYSLTIIYDL